MAHELGASRDQHQGGFDIVEGRRLKLAGHSVTGEIVESISWRQVFDWVSDAATIDS